MAPNAPKKARKPPVARSAIFGYIEQQQILHNGGSFGRVLDAGTGLHSLRWMATLLPAGSGSGSSSNRENSNDDDDDGVGISSFVGITADEAMKQRVEREAGKLGIPDLKTTASGAAPTGSTADDPGSGNRFVIGNWFATGGHKNKSKNNGNDTNDADIESVLRQTEGSPRPRFETILADYLIGAMDAFSPFEQDAMVPKLSGLLKPNGMLYLIGMEPVPDARHGEAGDVFCRVTRARDAVIKLAHNASSPQQRPYREYPMEWVRKKVAQDPLLREVGTRKLYLRYKHSNVVNQINVARGMLPYIDHAETAGAMKELLDELEKESKAATSKAKNNLVSVGGFDYIVVAQRIGVFEEFKARLVRDHPEALLSSLLALLCVCVVLAVRLSRARGHHRGSKRSGAKHEKQQ